MGAKFVNGPIDEGTTQLVPWGIWVSGYIFFLGLSAGSFLISTLIYVFGVKQLEEAGPAALVQALGCLLLGGILIVLDAGHPSEYTWSCYTSIPLPSWRIWGCFTMFTLP